MGINDIEKLRRIITQMQHSAVGNYATPGLTSQLVGGLGHGKLRTFVSDRDTRHYITPHSHLFDFACLVLAGEVRNVLYARNDANSPAYGGNLFAAGVLTPTDGGLGRYELARGLSGVAYGEASSVYTQGQVYGMRHNQIHSIYFSKGAEVLFFEGQPRTDHVTILEPWSNGKVVPTFSVEEWMFEREGEQA